MALLRLVARLMALGAVLSLVETDARAGTRSVEGVLNLNTAPIELLTLLPGIGPSKARAILSYRARRPFRTVDELVRVNGIGRRMVREMRAHLAISGPSTARGAAGTIVVEAPPAPPPVVAPARPVCRPAPGVLPRFAPPYGRDQAREKARLAFVKSRANHCAPSS